MTDFGPLLANPVTFLLGAAAQLGVFVAMIGAVLIGFNIREAASIGIIGGADGPTAIYFAAKTAPQIIGAIAVSAYSYMSLVPLIQPPVMKLCTTREQRKIVMKQLRTVSKSEKILFDSMHHFGRINCPGYSSNCRYYDAGEPIQGKFGSG